MCQVQFNTTVKVFSIENNNNNNNNNTNNDNQTESLYMTSDEMRATNNEIAKAYRNRLMKDSDQFSWRGLENIVDGMLPPLKEDVTGKLDEILTSVGYTKKGDTYVAPEGTPHSAVIPEGCLAMDYFADPHRY